MNFSNIYYNNSTSPVTVVDLYACRVCLATDIKLFDIHECDLAEMFEAVTSEAVPINDGFPQHLCHYCFALLQKFATFKEKCKRSHDILQTALLLNQPITTDYLRIIDREAENLNLPLTIHDAGLIDYEIIEETVEVDEKGIKEEVIYDEEHLEMEKEELYTALYDNNCIIMEQDVVESELVETEEVEGEERLVEIDGSYIDTDKVTIELPTDPVKREPVDFIPLHGTKVADHPNIEIVTLSKEQQFQELNHRKDSANYVSAFYKCDKCYRGFYNALTYRNHMVLHNPSNGEIECDICEMRFPTEAKLKVHTANVHEKKFVCTICRNVSNSSHRAIQHQRWHDGVTYDCKHCGETFKKSAACLAHVRKYHPSNLVCDECGEVFISRGGLQAHRAKVHRKNTSNETWIQCQACDAEFKGVVAFNRHVDTASKHTGNTADLTFYCKNCGESFETEVQLQDHKLIHVTQSVACPECNVEVESHEELTVHCHEAHAGTSAGAKRFICEICGRGFSSSVKLLTHRRVHSLDKPYICPFCQKAFKFPQYLQIHVRVHTGEKPYVCSICSMAFQAKANLNRHLKVHTGEKPYMCDLCGRSFTQSNSMKMHVKTVHLKMPDPYKDRRKYYKNKNKPNTLR